MSKASQNVKAESAPEQTEKPDATGDGNTPGEGAWRSLYIHEWDKSRLEELAEESPQTLNPPKIIRMYLPKMMNRIDEGKYDPMLLSERVGTRRLEEKRKQIVLRTMSLEWGQIQKAADRVNDDLKLAKLYHTAFEEPVDKKPYRPCDATTIIRATAHKMALQEQVYCEGANMLAKDLREKAEREIQELKAQTAPDVETVPAG
jgi:hypothetical protein